MQTLLYYHNADIHIILFVLQMFRLVGAMHGNFNKLGSALEDVQL